MRKQKQKKNKFLQHLTFTLCLSQMVYPFTSYAATTYTDSITGNKTTDGSTYTIDDNETGKLKYIFANDDEIIVEADNTGNATVVNNSAEAKGVVVPTIPSISELQINSDNLNLTINAFAQGGIAFSTSSGQFPNSGATVYGIQSTGTTDLIFGSNITINTSAIGNDSTTTINQNTLYSNALSYGISNTSSNTSLIEFGDNTKINLLARAGSTQGTSAYSNATAYGVWTSNSNTIDFGSSLQITGEAYGGTANDDPFLNTSSRSETFSTIRGINNLALGNVTTGTNALLNVKSFGGKSDSRVQNAHTTATTHGVYNNNATTTFGDNLTIIAEATGGEAENQATNNGNAKADAIVFGIENKAGGTVTAQNNNNITVNATGGSGISTATSGGNTASATATGISNDENSSLIIGNTNEITVNSQGGNFNSSQSSGPADATSTGIKSSGNTTLGNSKIIVNAKGGLSQSSNANAESNTYGVYTQGSVTLTVNGDLDILGLSKSGEATGTSASSVANARGIFSVSNNTTTNFNHDVKIDIQAEANSAKSTSGNANASSNTDGIYVQSNSVNFYGDLNITTQALGGTSKSISGQASSTSAVHSINNLSGTVTLTDNSIFTASASSGQAISDSGEATSYSEAVGVYNLYANAQTNLGENNTFNIYSKSGNAISNSGKAIADAEAYGFVSSQRNSAINVDGKININAYAEAGNAEGNASSTANALAAGAYADSNSVISFNGDLNIFTQAKAGIVNGIEGDADTFALLTSNNGIINVNQTGSQDVQLTGNISILDSGSIKVNLDTPDSYWRPIGTGDITADFGGGNFLIGNGAAVDLSWTNNPLNRGSTGPLDNTASLTVNGKAIIEDGAAFIINSDVKNDRADYIVFNNVQSATGTQYIKIGYDPFIYEVSPDETVELIADPEIPWLQLNGSNIDNNLEGALNLVATPLYNYNVIPVIGYDKDTGKAVITGLEVTNPPVVPPIDPPPIDPPPVDPPPIDPPPVDPPPRQFSETPLTAIDAQLTFRNLWVSEMNNMMRRMGDLRMNGPEAQTGLWTRYFGGELKGNSCNERGFGQRYNGFQIGYDKKLEFSKGHHFVGLLVNYVNSTPRYERGNGKGRNTGIGIYKSTMYDSGHYFDLVLKASKLRNEYDVYDVSNNYVSGKNDAWAYGIGLEYGYRMDLRNDWFLEPSVEINLGRIGKSDYTTSNGLEVKQKAINTFTGRAGVLLGKYFSSTSESNAYLRLSYVGDYSSIGDINVRYNNLREKLNPSDKRGNALEINLGTNIKMSDKNDFYLELTKSFGGEIKTDWQVNAGLRFSF